MIGKSLSRDLCIDMKSGGCVELSVWICSVYGNLDVKYCGLFYLKKVKREGVNHPFSEFSKIKDI